MCAESACNYVVILSQLLNTVSRVLDAKVAKVVNVVTTSRVEKLRGVTKCPETRLSNFEKKPVRDNSESIRVCLTSRLKSRSKNTHLLWWQA